VVDWNDPRQNMRDRVSALFQRKKPRKSLSDVTSAFAMLRQLTRLAAQKNCPAKSARIAIHRD
jgi:hypothetical protein